MTGTGTLARRLAAAMIVGCGLLLSGCFMADRDARGENSGIVTPDSSTQPIGSGPVRICNNAGANCEAWRMKKSEGWGYIMSAPDADELTFFMKALKGAGIPSQTYLVEAYSSNIMLAGTYTLNLAIRQPDGAWLIHHPDCEWAVVNQVLAQLPWVREGADGSCRIARAGLTDQRLYETLRQATPAEQKFRLYQGS